MGSDSSAAMPFTDVLRKVRGFVFDFDGTLALLNIDFRAMREDIAGLIDRFGLRAERFQSLNVLEMVECVQQALEGEDREMGAEFFCEAHVLIKERELRAAGCGGLLSWTRPLLEHLGAQGFARGIITRNCEEAVRVVFPEIDEYCEAFFPRNRVTRVKPHPDHLCSALSCMGVEADRAVMVGDHPIDVQCGRAQGLITIGVLTGNADRQRLEEAGAFLVLSHVGQIIPLLHASGRTRALNP